MSCAACRASGCPSGGVTECACAESRLAPPSNRPGLAELRARLGDYRDFFADAVARLSDPARPALRELGTRDLDDPAIAWLDAWAIAADVLTFYRERLTNESYLRTAQDEYALRELAALVGFKPRPGVSATAFLAYLMDGTAKPAQIPLHAKAQSVPGPGEQMQTFETDEPFKARAEWSQLAPRSLRRPRITLADAVLRTSIRLKGAGLLVRPGERVLFLFDPRSGHQVVREVVSARADILKDHVELQLKPVLLLPLDKAIKKITELEELRDDVALAAAVAEEAPDIRLAFQQIQDVIASFLLGGSAGDAAKNAEFLQRRARELDEEVLVELQLNFSDEAGKVVDYFSGLLALSGNIAVVGGDASTLEDVLGVARRSPVTQLASGRLVARVAGEGLKASGAERVNLLSAMNPQLSEVLPQILRVLPASEVKAETAPSIFLLRVSAGAFGAVAPRPFRSGKPTVHDLDLVDEDLSGAAFLDAAYDGIQSGSFALFDRPFTMDPGSRAANDPPPGRILRIARVRSAQTVARGAYGISAKTTRLELVRVEDAQKAFLVMAGIEGLPERIKPDLGLLRHALCHAQSETVELAWEPVEEPVSGADIELQVLIFGLQPGQRIIVSGERTDITDANGMIVPGVRAAELAMIREAKPYADARIPGDALHTALSLVKPLSYSYKRDTCTVYGNVVQASHGESVSEVIGDGRASQAGQKLVARRGPLSFTPAPTLAGSESAESVRVNGIQYRRVESLLDGASSDRIYQLEVDRDGVAAAAFGDGRHGARLPTGSQNARMDYRVGIGVAGNVRAEQINLLVTRPLGVTGVVNPLPASGGADRDGPQRIRRGAPLAARMLSPLARLVSVQDYAEFARRFAGIGQADAVQLSDGTQRLVHVTVAGVDDSPLDPEGPLLANLRSAYALYGDPAYPVEVAVRELRALLLQAKVAIHAEASWDLVEPAVRSRLGACFDIERRTPGQPAYLSEAIAAIQATPGVAWVDVDRFGSVTEVEVRDARALEAAIARLDYLARIVNSRRAGLNPGWSPGSGQPRILPAELVFIVPSAPGLIVLNPA